MQSNGLPGYRQPVMPPSTPGQADNYLALDPSISISTSQTSQSSEEEAAFIADDLAEFFAEKSADNMGPVYRLVR